jgi:phage portal protein BeeE
MALFNRVTKAAISPHQDGPGIQAAAGGMYGSNGSGEASIGKYYSYVSGDARNKAMSVATISRSRDLLASVLSCTPLEMYQMRWNAETLEEEEIPLPPKAWMKQPDPQLSYAAFMAWLFDDLFFFGRAFLWVSSRDAATGLPASFSRLPAAMVNTLDIIPPVVAYGTSKQIFFQGAELPYEDVIQFVSPIQGILYQSPQIVATAIELQNARLRNATSSIPASILKQVSGEPLDAEGLAQLASSFNQARLSNQTAALNQYVDYIPTGTDPSKMMLMEAAEFQAKEAARLCNVPFFLAGLDIGSYSYSSNQGAREDLYVFGARAYMNCIQETLSMQNVLPKNICVRFDIDDYLSEMIETEEDGQDEYPLVPIVQPNQVGAQ